ncbi:FCD domain-containing protein [Nesterenkonia salmonea]|uniref:FCD domain-containing protein n=1 Tax=Nesterenkonia salmonea TaxID=1804987 RepID=A0A5R9BLQ7_9MICC|nr:FCD domain-containing protein [Nesterenkonia salmonea]TLQ01043.1 FCD domain-containing protein [Nesterenkonia salmonea]
MTAVAPESRKADYTHLTPEEFRLIRILSEFETPTGARVVTRQALDEGVELSEATVSRILLRLDRMGLTTRVERKGRLVTEEGRQLVDDTQQSRLIHDELRHALNITDVSQLVDLLRARRGLEQEAALLAAQHATAEDLEELRANVELYRRTVGTPDGIRPGMEFHRLLIRAARSPLLEAIARTILYDPVEKFEPALSAIVGEHGDLDQAVAQHVEIVDAVEAGDADRARRLVHAHLSDFLEEADLFTKHANPSVVRRLLALIL